MDVLIRFVPKSNSSETLWAYILWPRLVLIGQYLQMLECKQSQIPQFFQIQGQITLDVLIRFVLESNSSETLWAYILWTSFVLIGQYLQMLECKQSLSQQFFQIQGKNNFGFSDSICPIIDFIRDFMAIYTVANFGTDWSIFANDRV